MPRGRGERERSKMAANKTAEPVKGNKQKVCNLIIRMEKKEVEQLVYDVEMGVSL